MDRLIVRGGTRLSGTVRVSGAKNSALKLMAASLLAEGRSVIGNVPKIQDCRTMTEVLDHLGARTEWVDGAVSVDTSQVRSSETPYELVSPTGGALPLLRPPPP